MHRRSHLAPLMALLLGCLAGCSALRVTVTQTPGVQLAGQTKFRMNYDVHDPDGKRITDEIMQTDLDRWYEFMELVVATRASFEDRGYLCVNDPTEPADFVVDVCFTSFYSDTLDEERMQAQKLATFLIGRKRDTQYEHLMVVAVLARDPNLKTDDFITVWEGRAGARSATTDARLWALPLIGNIVAQFPKATTIN